MVLQSKPSYRIRNWIDNLWDVYEVVPRGLVIAVYDGSEAGEEDSNGLLPGQVKVNTTGEWLEDREKYEGAKGSEDVNAWVVSPYGMRPDTGTNQKSHSKDDRAYNQNYGFFSMPRVGDNVFMIGMKSSPDLGIPMIEWYVLGTVPSEFVSKPQPNADKEDLQMVHRSGSSIRFNDTYEGGGAIGDLDAPGHMDGVTGNVSVTGNRFMILSGRKYLPHGLMSKYGDPRSGYSDAKIDKGEGGSSSYSDIFSSDVDSNQIFDPFEDSPLGSKKFLMPPSSDDSTFGLTDNTMLFVQQGGGFFRVDDHNSDDSYSRMTMGAASMSLMIGQEYRDMGLSGDSSSPEDADDAEGVDTDIDTFEIQHKSGARVKILDTGEIQIFTAKDQDITITDEDGEGKVYLGNGEEPVIINDDSTTTDKADGALITVPDDTAPGNLGIPVPHIHNGHKHKTTNSQERTYA